MDPLTGLLGSFSGPGPQQTMEAMGKDTLTALAVRGYYKGEEIFACEKACIAPYAPKSQTSNSRAKRMFGERDFQYTAEDNEYPCPAGHLGDEN